MPLPHALHFIHAHTHMPSPHNLHFISRTHAHAIATCFALHFTHARACHRHSFCTLFHAHTCKPLPHILHFILRTRMHATATHFALHFKHARTHARTQVCNTFLGTVTYMSPERINNEQYSFSADIWSLVSLRAVYILCLHTAINKS